MGYGRRYLKRSGKAASTALARRRVRRAGKVAVIALLAGLERGGDGAAGNDGRGGTTGGERRDGHPVPRA
jgi:hypothetical protein